MPYHLKAVGNGKYKVEVHGKTLSKHGMSKEQAEKQRAAVIISEKRRGKL